MIFKYFGSVCRKCHLIWTQEMRNEWTIRSATKAIRVFKSRELWHFFVLQRYTLLVYQNSLKKYKEQTVDLANFDTWINDSWSFDLVY